jgi:hypothetical protein
MTALPIHVDSVHVDRDEELRLFRSLLRGQDKTHMLLIQAGSGMGKSALMEQLYSESVAYPRAIVDLRPQAYTPLGVLGEMVSGLETTIANLSWAGRDRVSDFPNFTEARRRYGHAEHTDIQDVRLSDVTQTASSGMPREEQAARQIITDLFFQDLDVVIHRYGKVVLIIDTYEKASIDVKQWLKSIFLNRIRGRSGVIVILAGRAIPGPWEFATTHQLMPLDLPYVQEYVRRAQLPVSEEEVKVLYEVTAGVPLDFIMSVTKLLLRRGWRRQ